MRITLILILCLCFGGLCLADEKEAVISAEPSEISITTEERLSVENAQLKIQVLQQQLDALVKQLVAKYKIDVQGWSYDAVNGKFVKIKQDNKK